MASTLHAFPDTPSAGPGPSALDGGRPPSSFPAVPARPVAVVTSPTAAGMVAVAAVADPAVAERAAMESQERTAADVPWQVVVWDDPVNLMSWVTWVFRTYFGYSQPKAHTLMMEVHTRGRAVVAAGTLEQAEKHVAALHGYGLWATYERATGTGGAGDASREGGF